MASRRGKKHQHHADPEHILAGLQLHPWLALEAKAELPRQIEYERRRQANPALQKFRLSPEDLVRCAITAAQQRMARDAAPPVPRDPTRRLRYFGLQTVAGVQAPPGRGGRHRAVELEQPQLLAGGKKRNVKLLEETLRADISDHKQSSNRKRAQRLGVHPSTIGRRLKTLTG